MAATRGVEALCQHPGLYQMGAGSRTHDALKSSREYPGLTTGAGVVYPRPAAVSLVGIMAMATIWRRYGTWPELLDEWQNPPLADQLR